jgi:hypothetical protein
MMSSWYRAVFTTRLSSPRAPLQELVTTQGGFRLATSVGGVLTGRGADLIVIATLNTPVACAMTANPKTE